MHSYTNELINETSPYLLQHAHNPVNWYPWGEEALSKAKAENKPILVSIGYSACHWCHVMERESFEDEATAKMMNENFINIKIDREERPDLDHIYMDAVQAMTGSGGWPLNVFLTPAAKPFYGGTYFPPQKAYNRPSWQETLLGVVQAFRERRHEIDAQAENLTEHLLQSNSFGIQKVVEEEIFTADKPDEIFQNLSKSADKEWGGFGKAPKFPQTFSIQFLLRYYHITKNEDALQQALLSLDKMIEGGIYDQVGGGFARYSTDTEWLAPHFEKMLYDNALLVSVLSEAFQLTSHTGRQAQKDRYREVIEETMEFLQRELLHPSNGFYAALDADSEGVEGKFYVWSIEEIKKLLGKDAPVFCEYYDVSEFGNWEHINILRTKKTIQNFAIEKNISVDDLKEVLSNSKKILLEERINRIRPSLDDKIILGWNALMNTACSKAFSATGNEAYRQLAIDNMQFLLTNFKGEKENEFHHTWKEDIAKYPAFLDDYAFLVQALIHLQEITADTKWLTKAKGIAEFVIQNFSEAETDLPAAALHRYGFFFYTPASQTDVIVRKKEVYDGAVPSGNSIMAYNLHHLSILFDKEDPITIGWGQRSVDMISSLGRAITRYPTSFGNWACLLQEMIAGTNEIAVVGYDFSIIHAELLRQYIPHRVLMATKTGDSTFPLLAEKPVTNTPQIYLCRNNTCLNPVFSAKDLISLIYNTQKP
ncbi:MAG: thioredoxin domain-containing protein [Chitinophagaceae bacterium]|nr:thioredoxin domain-containing protein [Chitinophagaceae bacterium]